MVDGKRSKLPIRRCNKKSIEKSTKRTVEPATQPIETSESDEEDYEQDDCVAVCENIEDGLEEDHDDDGIGVEEELFSNLEECFGNIVNDDLNANNDNADSGDDAWNDDVIPEPMLSDYDDSDDNTDERSLRNPNGDDQVLWLGQTFSAVADFKYALLMYTLKTEYDVKMYKSEASRIAAKCSDNSCPWRVYCSFQKSKNKLMVKVYINEHICVRSGYSKVLKISSLSQLFEERLRKNPKFSVKEMVDEVKMKYNLIVSENQCKKVKTKLVSERKACHEKQFARIWDYQAEILASNPGSTMEIDTIPGPTPCSLQRFYRLYLCFESLRESWKKSCRPIIGVDGTFLKWDIKGVLVVAVGRDGDNSIFPIAWAVIDVENNDNWEWFIKHLKDDLMLGDGRNITIISDKHRGILNAVENIIPQAEHRMCARHILGNWKKNNTDMELERLFWRIARSYTTGDFADNLEALRKYNQGAYDSLQRTRPTKWSRAFFKVGSCCNDNLNNLNESFNRVISNARKKPLLDMLEDIRRQCMQRNAKRLIVANRLKTKYTLRAHAEIEIARGKAKECIMYMSTRDLHEIDDHGVAYRVDMVSKTCGCVKWQLNGIPCIHAMCVITALKLKPEDYVSHYFMAENWRQAYVHGIRPVQGMTLWPRLNRLHVLPPPSRLRTRGRESSHAWRRGPYESSSDKRKLTRHGRVPTCSRCKQEGHNKRRCSNPHVILEKRPQGRPRKHQEGEVSHGRVNA